MAENKLLGSHKPSAEWYTPLDCKRRIVQILGLAGIFDPCPAKNTGLTSDKPMWEIEYNKCFYSVDDGLITDWIKHKFIYCNPPSPAAPWAKKAIETVKESKDTIIIFAAFSEAVLWQCNELLDYPTCFVRNRISWIDGNEFITVKEGKIHCITDEIEIGGKWYKPNPNYLKPSKSPRNYNAFVLLAPKDYRWSKEYCQVEGRFCWQFSELGTVQLSRQVHKP